MRRFIILPLGMIVLISACMGISHSGEKPEFEKVVDEGKLKVNVPAPGLVLPEEDVLGEDLSDVPRYSPSVRVSYDRDTSYGAGFVSIGYYTEDGLSKVRSFYLAEMPKLGWKAVSEEAQPGINLPFAGAPFGGMGIGESRLIDFRREECTDPGTCLPYAKITLGSFEIGGESYTYIGIDYEAQAEEDGAQGETVPPETGGVPSTPVTPTSDFGKELDSFLKDVLESALGTEAVLTSYSEFGGAAMEYTLGSPVQEVSDAAGAIKAELMKRGIPEQIVIVDVSVGSAYVSVMSWEFFGKTGMLNINIYKGSKEVEVSFVMLPGGG